MSGKDKYADQKRWIKKNMTTISIRKSTAVRLKLFINKQDVEWDSYDKTINILIDKYI